MHFVLQDWLIQFGTTHIYIIYIVIVLIGILEGPILSVLLGILLRLNHFYFLPVYAAVMAGDLIGDCIWYYIGYFYGMKVIKKLRKYFSITEEKIEKVKILFHDNKYKILFISKLTNGLGFAIPVLTTAGIVRIPFWKFMRTNIAGQLLWSAGLLSIGYFFGDLYSKIPSILGKGFLAGLIVVIAVLVFQYIQRFRRTLE